MAKLLMCAAVIIFFASPAYGIEGGENANYTIHPYMVLIQPFNPFNTICGGAFIAQDWAVTSAKCITSTGTGNVDYFAQYGTANQSDINSKIKLIGRYVIHPEFNSETLDNDIALAYMVLPNTKVDTVEIATTAPTDGDILTLTGWGYINKDYSNFTNYPNTLQEIKVSVLGQGECENAYKNYEYPIGKNMFCGSATDERHGKGVACPGDFGAPAVLDGKLVGMVSLAMACVETPEFPDAYMKLQPYIPWIQSAILNNTYV